VKAVRCVGQEWWTVESQPTEGPASDARHLWRFDVTDALARRFPIAAAWAAGVLILAAIVLVVTGRLGVVLAIAACGYAIGALAAALLIRTRRPHDETHRRSR
jgi:hypothetical protein